MLTSLVVCFLPQVRFCKDRMSERVDICGCRKGRVDV